jgi:hypothetical protein
MKAWCQQHQIIYTTFIGWRSRLKRTVSQRPTKDDFIELKNSQKDFSDIVLEYDGIKIHLPNHFDPSALRKCLNVLRGAQC